MAVNWNDLADDAPKDDWDALTDDPNRKPSALRRYVADPAISLLKGAISIPESAVGLADIVTGGAAGRGAEDLGFRPKDARAALDELLSPEQQAANKRLQDASGFVDTVATAVTNPSTIGHAILESAPLMGGGGVVARGLMKAAPKVGGAVAGGIGEGTVGAGSAAEQIRQETPGGEFGAKQALSALGSGAGTAAFGVAGGKFAQSKYGKKLGLTDIDTAIAQGTLTGPAGASKVNFLKKLAAGGVSEGFFEELPQSAQEQMWQNYALGKPIMEKVPEAAAMGMVVGAAQGGAVNAISGSPASPPPPPAPAAAPPPNPSEPPATTPHDQILRDVARKDERAEADDAGPTEPPPGGGTPSPEQRQAAQQGMDDLLRPDQNAEPKPGETYKRGNRTLRRHVPGTSTTGPIDPITGDEIVSEDPPPAANPRELEALRAVLNGEELAPEDSGYLAQAGLAKVQPDGTYKILPAGRRRLKALEAAQPAAEPEQPLAPKTVAGVPTEAHSDEQLQALAASPETPATTRHAAATALQARAADQETETARPKQAEMQASEAQATVPAEENGARAPRGAQDDQPAAEKATTVAETAAMPKVGTLMPNSSMPTNPAPAGTKDAAPQEAAKPVAEPVQQGPTNLPAVRVPSQFHIKTENDDGSFEDLGEGPFDSREEAETFARAEVGVPYEIVETRAEIQGQQAIEGEAPSTAVVPAGRTIDVTPEKPAKELPAQKRERIAAEKAAEPVKVFGKTLDKLTRKELDVTAKKHKSEKTREAAQTEIARRDAERQKEKERERVDAEDKSRKEEAERDAVERRLTEQAEELDRATETTAATIEIPRGEGKLTFDQIAGGSEKDGTFTIRPARYAKGKVIVQTPSTTGFKSRAARLAGHISRDQYTGREHGYVMSPAQAERFYKLFNEGTDAGAISNELIPPKAPESPPLESTTRAESAGLAVLKPNVFDKFAPWVGNRLKEAEAKGEQSILALGVAKEYAIYSKGHRVGFDGDGSNKGSIISESSGNPVEIAVRHGEDNIIAMTSAAKNEIDERRTELESKRAADDVKKKEEQDNLQRTVEKRNRYFETIAAVELPKGVKKTITGKTTKGEALKLDGTDYDGLFLHKNDRSVNEPYVVSDTKSTLRIAVFPRIASAKDFIRGVIHANLPRDDLAELTKADNKAKKDELKKWLEVVRTHTMGGEVPAYFREGEAAGIPQDEGQADTGTTAGKITARPTGFPAGGWYAVDENGDTMRFGKPEGEMPRRFDDPDKAVVAGERWRAKNPLTPPAVTAPTTASPMAEAVTALRAAADAMEKAVSPAAEKTASSEKPAAADVANPPQKSTSGEETSQIADFGEKIGGARKDVWQSFKDRMKDAQGVDVAAEPLSKSWPAPDYQALLDSGADSWAVAFMHAARDAVPAKPKVGWKLRSWVESTKMLRDTAIQLANGELSVEKAKALLADMGEKSRGLRDIAGRIELYELVGHSKSLDGVSVTRGDYSIFEGKEYKPAKIIWSVQKETKATAFSNWPRMLATGDTKAEALAAFKAKYAELTISEPASKETTFEIYSKRNEDGYWIGKKIGRNPTLLEGPFKTVKEARTYKAEHQAELVAKLEKVKEIPNERRDTNNPRVGEDMRNGQDVTPKMFGETFGFRGVEFGNWVEQGKRQTDLNDAFDALMDMAAILNVPPKAISLNGELGLAFGARGSGGVNPAKAHYEPGHVVINLTKKEGAGSIGHEFWHALDNYFSRMRGKKADYLTEGLDVSLAARGSNYVHQGEVRKEMVDAFGAVVRSIKETALRERAAKLDAKRSKEYWTTGREMSARAFESYLISKLQDQGASNDYLANIVDEATWKAAESLGWELDGSYPYPTAGEIPKIRAGFDHFFQTVQTKETDKGVAMFSRAPTYTKDPSGAPLLHVNGLDLSGPQALHPDFVTDGTAYQHNVMQGDRKLGVAMLNWKDGKVTELLYIKTLRNLRGQGIAERVVSGILSHNEGQSLRAVMVLPEARGFWEKMGAEFVATEDGEDGILTQENYSEARGAREDAQAGRRGDAETADREGPAGPGDARSGGRDQALIRQAVEKITAKWGNAPPVVVVDSMQSPEVPADVRSADAKQRSQGATGEPEGFYHQGKVYLVAEGIASPERAVTVLFHEALGHAGLRGVFGDRLNAVLDDVARAMPGRVQAKATEYGLDFKSLEDRRQASEEVLAVLAQTMPRAGLVKRAIAAIRQFLREIGFDIELSDNDVISQFITPARTFVERGNSDVAYTSQNSAAAGLLNASQAGALESDPSSQEAKEVQAGVEGKGLEQAALFIAKQAPERSYRMIAFRVLRQIRRLQNAGMKFDIRVAHVGDMVPAGLATHSKGITERKFNSDTTTVWLNGADVNGRIGTSYETVLHELLHAVTQTALYVGNRRVAVGTQLFEDTKDLIAVGNEIIATYNKRFRDANGDLSKLHEFERLLARGTNIFTDPGEIVSWAMTNRAFQEYLESVPYRGGSLWTRFVRAVRVALGLPEKADTALSEIIRISDNLLDTPAQSLIAMASKINLPVQENSVDGLKSFSRDQTDPWPDLRTEFDKFENGDDYYSPRDFLDAVQALVEDGRAPNSIEDSARAYEEAIREDFEEFAGRGDTEAPENAFVEAVRSALKSPPAFSRASDAVGAVMQSPKVSGFLSGLTKSPTSLGYLNAFQTQYHKAEMLARKGMPQFKAVFDRLNTYLTDISAIAVKAEQQAPAIFRELTGIGPKSMKAFFKGAASEKDVQAIGPWLARGTLYGGGSPMEGVVWTKDELMGKRATNGRVLPQIQPLTEFQVELYQQARKAIDQSLEDNAKAILHRHVAKLDVTFDRDMSLADVAETSREQLRQQVEDLDIRIEAATVRADESHAEHLAAKEKATQTKSRTDRVDMDNAKKQRDADERQLDNLKAKREAVTNLIGDSTAEAARKRQAGEEPIIGLIDQVEEKAKGLIAHGYMPLSRFGNRTVTAKDAEGKVQFFGTYDGQPLVPGSANREMYAAAKAIKEAHPEWTVTPGIKAEKAWKMYQGLSLEALENFMDFLDPETKAELQRDAVIQEYLSNAVNNRSVLKRLIHRQGTAGFSTDVPRILAAFVTSNARNASGLYNLGEAKRLVNDIPQEQGDVVDEAAELVEYVTKPGEEAAVLRGFLFFHFLGGSVAAAAVNLTQTPMVTAPYLSQHASMGDVAAAIGKAAKLAVQDPASMTGSMGDALQKAERDGVTAPQQIYHLTATAANNPFSSNRQFRTFMTMWGGMFGAAEVFNRRVAFLAAYEIANKNDIHGAAAYAFANKAVTETQFIYSKVNRPNLGRGALGATVMTFKTFSISYLELLRRMPPKQQLMMLGMLLLVAGGEGLPFEEDVADAVDVLGQWLGFATNTKKWTGKVVKDTFGEDLARPILKGLGGMLPLDLHSRLGMGNLIPATAYFKQSEIDKTRDVAEAVGPVGSVLKSFSDSLQLLARGKWDNAAVGVAPKALRDAYNGAHMAVTGESQDTKGRLAMRDVTAVEGFGKAIGFNPQRAATEGEAKREIMLDKNLRTVRMDEIASDWADGILQKDSDKTQAARDRLREWNTDNPEMRILPANIMRSVQERVRAARKTSAERFLKSTPKPMRADAREAFNQ